MRLTPAQIRKMCRDLTEISMLAAQWKLRAETAEAKLAAQPAPAADAREVEDDGVVHNLRGRWMTAEDIAAHDAALLKECADAMCKVCEEDDPFCQGRRDCVLRTAIEGRRG